MKNELSVTDATLHTVANHIRGHVCFDKIKVYEGWPLNLKFDLPAVSLNLVAFDLMPTDRRVARDIEMGNEHCIDFHVGTYDITMDLNCWARSREERNLFDNGVRDLFFSIPTSDDLSPPTNGLAIKVQPQNIITRVHLGRIQRLDSATVEDSVYRMNYSLSCKLPFFKTVHVQDGESSFKLVN